MAFKINKQKRVRIPVSKLHEFRRDYPDHNFYTFLWNFEGESGLKSTSTRLTKLKGTGTGLTIQTTTYFFKIVDVNKYMLAKIKYGI